MSRSDRRTARRMPWSRPSWRPAACRCDRLTNTWSPCRRWAWRRAPASAARRPNCSTTAPAESSPDMPGSPTTWRRSTRSANASTASRWPSSWRRRGSGPCPPATSSSRSTAAPISWPPATRAPSDRHRSMHAVLDSTWRSMSARCRAALPRLSVFVGGFSGEAAVAVAETSSTTLESLTELSLIRRLPDNERGARYGMHELVRTYAVEMLHRHGPDEVDRAHARHLEYFLDLYERAHADVDTPEEQRWLRETRRELANAGAALRWAHDHGRAEQALRMTAAVSGLGRILGVGTLPGRVRSGSGPALGLGFGHPGQRPSRSPERRGVGGHVAPRLGFRSTPLRGSDRASPKARERSALRPGAERRRLGDRPRTRPDLRSGLRPPGAGHLPAHRRPARHRLVDLRPG